MSKQNNNMDKNSTPNNPQRRARMSINEFITPISHNPNRIPGYLDESRRSSQSSLGILEIDTLSDIGKDVDFEENFDLKTFPSQKSSNLSSQRAIEARQKMQKALASKAIGEIDKKNFDQQFKENIGGDYFFEKSNEIPGGNSRINSLPANGGIPSYLLRPDDSLELTLTNTPIVPTIEISNMNVAKENPTHENKNESFSFSSMSLGEFKPADEAMSILQEKHWQDETPLELKDLENKNISAFSTIFSDDHQISVSSSKLGADFHNYKGKVSPSKYFRMRSELMIPIENPLSKSPTKIEDLLNTSIESVLSISKIHKLVSETSSGNLVDQLLIKSKISPKVLKERPVLDNTQRTQSLGCPCHLKVPSQTRSKSVSPRISPNITLRTSRSVSPNYNYPFHTSLIRKKDISRNIERQFNHTAPSTKVPEWDESCRMSAMSNFADAVSLTDSEIDEPWLFITDHEQRMISINEKYIQEYVYFHNMSGRQLKCTIRLDHVLGGNGEETIKWPQHTVSFAPFSSKDAKILISPKVIGHLDLFFKISIQDNVTHREQILSHQMKFIISESSSKEASSLTSKNSGSLKIRTSSSSVDSGRSSYMTHPSATKSVQSNHEKTQSTYEKITPTKSTSRHSRKTSTDSPRTSTPKSQFSNENRSSLLNNINENSNKETFKIQATAGEVIWASIPVGSRKTQSIKVRHFGPLCKIQVNILNDATNSFSVLNDEGEWVCAFHFIQKDKEITSLKFGLMPRTTGQCTADVKITALLNEKKSCRVIPLFGFGGEAHLILKGLNRDNAGRLSLKLGKLRIMERQRRLGACLHVRNDGSIPGFFAITEIIPELNSLSFNSLSVSPKTFILPPGFSEDIQIEYKLNMGDIRWISQSKEEKNGLVTLNIFYGDEPTRRRLCKIFEKFPNKEFPEKLKYLVNNSNFSNEFHIPNAYHFNDPWSALSELSLTLKDMQIRLEIERELDEASLLVKAFEKTDDHLSFQTLAENTQDTTFLSEMGPPIAPPINHSLAKRHTRSKPYIEIEPTMLFFSSQIKNSVVILHNLSPVMQNYEISSPDSHLFKYNAVGNITPGDKIPIHISSTATDGRNYKTLISVYVENDRIDIPVTFLPS